MDDKKQLQLDEKYYSVVANDIIRGKQKMTLREMQLLQLVISQIAKHDTELCTYTTTVVELAHFLGVSRNNLYRDLDQITDKLMSRVIKINVDGKYRKFNWLHICEYDPDTKQITLQLHDSLKPYLTALERFYSQIKIETVLAFKSYYALRLYQLLVCNWGESGQSEYTFTIEQIRDFFQTEDKYKLNRDLLNKTIKPALTEINDSDYCVVEDYTENHAKGKGSPIESVSFRVHLCKDAEQKKGILRAAEILRYLKAGDAE